ncbi:ABC transporter permease [Hoeflea alexandrii]|uniref:ABC transporter permease n=1 Tax=Hoeflea alexandrii TaxID=288436 RepID=UPI00226EF206|nr:ABC transporter permease [Hoeflea alexandrii]MCY0155022.1 ABC transporter permease [Hoeflea alexandrii]
MSQVTTLPEAVASTDETSQGGRSYPFLLVPISLFFLLLGLAVLRSPSLVTSAGIGSAIIVATPLILATYALMAVVISGRGTVDLSVGPLIGFVNVTLIQLHGADVLESPIAVFAYAIAVGAAYQLIFALIVIYVRVQPIIVSLSGYLALSGLNLVILPRPGGVAPQWMADWGLGTSIFSPVLLILVLASIGWLLFTQTAFFTHLRLMGSDERAAYTSGVPIFAVRIGAHLISGCFAGLAAIAFTALISSGDPSQGTTYTLIAVTALVLGGASLAAWARRRVRLVPRGDQSLFDHLRACDVQFRRGAKLCHQPCLWLHPCHFAALDAGHSFHPAASAQFLAAVVFRGLVGGGAGRDPSRDI